MMNFVKTLVKHKWNPLLLDEVLINGTNGKDGLNGKDGKDGLNGRDGVNGRDGYCNENDIIPLGMIIMVPIEIYEKNKDWYEKKYMICNGKTIESESKLDGMNLPDLVTFGERYKIVYLAKVR
jgi:hypothetical protein